MKNIEIKTDEKIQISRIILKEKYSGEGYTQIRLKLAKCKYEFRFHIVDLYFIALDVEGIIGSNIMKDTECSIHFNWKKSIFFQKYEDYFPFVGKISILIV